MCYLTFTLFSSPHKDIIFIFFYRTFVGHEASIVGCDFSPDSNFIISGSCNGDIQVWDARYGHGKCLKYIEGHDLGVSCCQFSPTYGSAKCKYIIQINMAIYFYYLFHKKQSSGSYLFSCKIVF